MNLEELVVSFGEKDAEFKALKKDYDSTKETLKNLMGDLGTEKESFGGYTVTRTTSNRESFDEAKALEILKKDWNTHNSPAIACPYIKTIEVLDMDALESAMYNHQIRDDVIISLDECRKVTEVITMKCVKTKKGK